MRRVVCSTTVGAYATRILSPLRVAPIWGSRVTNVVSIITPKQMNRHYKRQKYTVTYVPATKSWKWEVTITTQLRFSEVAETQIKAFRAAEKFIDQHVKD